MRICALILIILLLGTGCGVIQEAMDPVTSHSENLSLRESIRVFTDTDAPPPLRQAQAKRIRLLSDELSNKPENTPLAEMAYRMLQMSLADSQSWVRETALKGMREITNIQRFLMDKQILLASVPRIYTRLRDQSEMVRNQAAWNLGALADILPDPKKKQALDRVRINLDDPSAEARSGAVWALGGFGEMAMRYRPEVIKKLSDASGKVRARALSALWMMSSKTLPSKNIFAKLIDMLLHDSDTRVRSGAARTLGIFCKLGKWRQVMKAEAKVAIFDSIFQSLVKSLRDENKKVRHNVIYTFLYLGTDFAARAVPYLEPYIRHRDHRKSVIFVLKRIDTKEARLVLKKHGIHNH